MKHILCLLKKHKWDIVVHGPHGTVFECLRCSAVYPKSNRKA